MIGNCYNCCYVKPFYIEFDDVLIILRIVLLCGLHTVVKQMNLHKFVHVSALFVECRCRSSYTLFVWFVHYKSTSSKAHQLELEDCIDDSLNTLKNRS